MYYLQKCYLVSSQKVSFMTKIIVALLLKIDSKYKIVNRPRFVHLLSWYAKHATTYMHRYLLFTGLQKDKSQSWQRKVNMLEVFNNDMRP